MAAALGAEYCEICSDVDGVYTADPRVVPAAQRIGTMSYEETQELAESGAKVLNAQAVEFAKERGIAIYARATSSPLPGADPAADGTVVRRDAPRLPGTVVGVASERDVIVIDADFSRRPAALREPQGTPSDKSRCDAIAQPLLALRDVLELLDEHKVAGKQLQVAGGRLTLVVSRENLHAEAQVRAALTARFGDGVRVTDALGALSVIGAGINATFDNVRRGSAALAAAGITVDAVATSSFRITWMIDRARLDEAVRLLHATFIEQR
jgi:aspartate kinase